MDTKQTSLKGVLILFLTAIIWGTSFVAGPQGEILYEASTDEEESIIVELDLDHSEQVRRWWPFFRDRRIDAYDDILHRFID